MKKVKPELWNKYYKDYYSIFRKFFRHYYVNGVRVLFKRDPVLPIYAGKKVLSRKKTNDKIAEMINTGKPFMISRFGGTELGLITAVMKAEVEGYTEKNKSDIEHHFKMLIDYSGFFPDDSSYVQKFVDMTLEASRNCDLLAMWHLYMEEYVIDEYLEKAELTHLLYLEPWLARNPWSSALSGKKVLVIHPFEKTIVEQYKKRELIFKDKSVLPEFELLTLKAVQTVAGTIDDRFDDWFEALEYMTNEALKKEFDIAIIGCGAYGMPLAYNLKKAGKQAIHLGGATQLMFGIKGKRWEKNYPTKIASLFNDAWVYPSMNEKPAGSNKVENSCYWR